MSRFKLNPLCAALMLSSMSIPAVSIAQEEALTLEEIIVTARNKEENLQDIPVAINAFSAKDLERQNINEMRDVVRASPGLTYDSAGSVATGNIAIRGMTQPGLIGDETNVAVFIDGVYVSGRTAAFAPMMGLERIEVVRGPQSALYGRNAFSGAMNYITKKPGQELEAQVEATAGDNGQNGIKARISGPLSETFAASLDLVSEETGSTFQDKGKYLGSLENNSQRLRALFTPTDNLEFDFSYTHIDSTESPQPGYEVAHNALYPMDFSFATGSWGAGSPEGYAGQVNAGAIDGVVAQAVGNEMTGDRYNLTATWDLEDVTLTSITAQNEAEGRALTGYDNTYSGHTILTSAFPGDPSVDGAIAPFKGFQYAQFGPTTLFAGADFTPGSADDIIVNELASVPIAFDPVFGFPTAFAPINMYILPTSYQGFGGQPNENREDFSQEFRIQSNNESSLQWSAGLLYAKKDVEEWLWSSPINPADGLSAAVLPFRSDAMTGANPAVMQLSLHETTTKSAFAAFSYDATERLNLGLEVRYTEEDKVLNNTTDNRAPGILFPTGKQEGSWDFVSPRLTATFNADDYTTMYLNVGKGTKSGGLNPGATSTEANYEPETNITYEIGAKRTVLDGRGYMNIALYQVDWDDQQIRQFSSIPSAGLPGVIVTNLGKVEIQGLEIETAFKVSTNWSFHAAYTFNDAEIKQGQLDTLVGFTDYQALGMGGVTLCSVAPSSCAGATGSTLVSDGNVSGNSMPNTVRNTVNLGMRYSRDMDSGMEFYTNVDIAWKDKAYRNETNTMWVEAHYDVNLQMGLEGDNWYSKLAVSNLLDDDTPSATYRPYVWTVEPKQTVINRMGRMASLSVGYKF